MLDFYPHLREALNEDKDDVLCRGLDCSGLLHQATQGVTVRNTSSLVSYGKELQLHLLSLKAIQAQLKPLDLIVWRGHVLIVRSATTVFESCINQGVIISDFEPRYIELVKMLNEQNKSFYFRRWHPEALSLLE